MAFLAIGVEDGTFQLLSWMQSAGGDCSRLTGPGGVAALTQWQALIDEKLASHDTLVRTQSDTFRTFVNGNAAGLERVRDAAVGQDAARRRAGCAVPTRNGRRSQRRSRPPASRC